MCCLDLESPLVTLEIDGSAYPWSQPTMDQKYWGKISKMQILNLPYTGNYLDHIYIVLGIISNLEMI